MEAIFKNGTKLIGEPEEFDRLKKLGWWPDDVNRSTENNGPRTNSPHQTSHGGESASIDPKVFFRFISPSMAKISLAFAKSNGRIPQQQLEEESGIKGASLRRPLGALNRRIREASGEQFKAISRVTANGGSGRIYEIPSQVIQFLHDHEKEFRDKLSESAPR